MCMRQHGGQGLKAHELVTFGPVKAHMVATLLLQHEPDYRAHAE